MLSESSMLILLLLWLSFAPVNIYLFYITFTYLNVTLFDIFMGMIGGPMMTSLMLLFMLAKITVIKAKDKDETSL
jgi:hypothetical protein